MRFCEDSTTEDVDHIDKTPKRDSKKKKKKTCVVQLEDSHAWGLVKFESQNVVMTSFQEQKIVSRGSIPMSRSENLQGFYSKWSRLERGVQFSQLSLLLFYFIASFCSLLDN